MWEGFINGIRYTFSTQGALNAQFLEAAEKGNWEIFEGLLEIADVDAKNEQGQTALHYAAENGHIAMVEALLQHSRVAVETKNNLQTTALHLAAKNGHKDVVTRLLEQCEHVDAQDYAGFTALHYAADSGHLDIVKMLLKKVKDVNITDYTNRLTALHLAATNGHLKTVEQLLRHDEIDVVALDSKGRTACYYAMYNEHTAVAERILGNGVPGVMQVRAADIAKYPPVINTYAPDTVVSIGDLHANPLKALYFLIREGVVKLSKEDFEEFVGNYKLFSAESETGTPEGRYQAILHMCKILQKIEKGEGGEALVEFFGDNVGDRGENDALMLELYKKLGNLGVKFHPYYANHESKFFACLYEYLTNPNMQRPGYIPASVFLKKQSGLDQYFAQYRSVYNFLSFADYVKARHPEQPDPIEAAINTLNTYYLPNLKIVSSVVNEEEGVVHLTTHAAAPLEAISELAEVLSLQHPKVEVDLNDPNTYENVNPAMRTILGKYINTKAPINDYWVKEVENPHHPLYPLIWDRYVESQPQPNPIVEGKKVVFYHGHDAKCRYKHSIGLDSDLGKFNRAQDDRGLYYVHSSQAPIATMRSDIMLTRAKHPHMITARHSEANREKHASLSQSTYANDPSRHRHK